MRVTKMQIEALARKIHAKGDEVFKEKLIAASLKASVMHNAIKDHDLWEDISKVGKDGERKTYEDFLESHARATLDIRFKSHRELCDEITLIAHGCTSLVMIEQHIDPVKDESN